VAVDEVLLSRRLCRSGLVTITPPEEGEEDLHRRGQGADHQAEMIDLRLTMRGPRGA
jgi:hypothetical protein